MQPEQPMRIFCRANTGLNVACRGDKVLLVPADSSNKSQSWFTDVQWIKDSSFVGNLTDNNGERAFALVNVTTGQALVNQYAEAELQLVPYSGHVSVELPMLWSQGKELVDGFSEIRALQEPYYTLNAYGGDPIREEAVVGTYRSQSSYDHAIWKIAPINQ
ncbi:hypothetical protein ACP70R_020534 [Stipagrostis hirtigluma subsp. patula]